MPEQVQRMHVFVASPGDTEDERNRLEAVVAELNRGIAGELGFVLELVRWETHVRPGIGSDAQAVINRQLPDPDVVIGIFWRRLGTPTPRADSGTAEEIEAAIRSWTDDDRVELLVYFNQAAYTPRAEDLAQIDRLFSFKAKLAEQGVLYWEYTGADDFEDKVRQHLTGTVRAWARPPAGPAAPAAPGDALPVPGAEVDTSNAARVDVLVAELRAAWLAHGFTRRVADRAATVLLELLANVRDHADASEAWIDIEMPLTPLRGIVLRVSQRGAGPDLFEALTGGWRAYEAGSREHGLVKAERLASHLRTIDSIGFSGVECTMFDPDPIGSGIFEEFGIPTYRVEYDVPRRCWLGDEQFDMSTLQEGVGWALHNHAERTIRLFLGGLSVSDRRPLGVEVTGNVLPSEIMIDRSAPVAEWPASRGARSLRTLEAGLEIAYRTAFERADVIFHAFDTGGAPEDYLVEWAARWGAPVFTSSTELRSHLEARVAG